MLDKKAREALLKQVADVPANVRLLIAMAANGACAYCLADLGDDSGDLLANIKRGLTGDKLSAAMAASRQRDIDNGIDPDTGHAVDCPTVAKGPYPPPRARTTP